MYIAYFKGYGKRLKRGRYNRPFVLYGQRFRKRRKAVLNENFIKEAGLGNPDTDPAILLSLVSDYGLSVVRRGPRPKEEVPPVIEDDSEE